MRRRVAAMWRFREMDLASETFAAAVSRGSRTVNQGYDGPARPWRHCPSRGDSATLLRDEAPLTLPSARAPVAQWIEQRFPEPDAQVRFIDAGSILTP